MIINNRFSSVDASIEPNGGRIKVSTSIALQLPRGTFGRIASRSGLAFNKGVVAFHGTIDEDFRGEIKILLFNFGREKYEIRKGDRICQLIVQKYEIPNVVGVESLESSERGVKGFGSSGLA